MPLTPAPTPGRASVHRASPSLHMPPPSCLPGEKKRLKKERMEAKRAARAASRGFDLAWVNRQLEEFVARQGDMQAGDRCCTRMVRWQARAAAGRCR